MSPPKRSDAAPPKPYQWLLFLIIALTVVAFTTVMLGLRYVEVRLVETAGESLALAASEITEKLDRLLSERYADVGITARVFSTKMADRAYMNDYLEWIRKSYGPVYTWLGVTDAHGRVIVATDPKMVGLEYEQADWFRISRERKAFHITEASVHREAGGQEAISFTAPIISPKGEFLGVTTGRIGISTLDNLLTRTLRTMEASEDFSGTLEYQFMSRSGDVFIDAATHHAPINLLERGLPSALLSLMGKPGYVEEEHLRRHVPVVTGYAQTQGFGEFNDYGWSILLRRDRSDILTPIHGMLWRLGLASAAVGLPALGLLFWSARRLQRECVQARYESQCARAAESALLQGQQRVKAVVDTSLDAVISMDADGLVTEWNTQAVRLFGWTRAEAIGRQLAETIIPQQYRELYQQGLHRFLTTGEGAFLNKRVETTACRKDGRELPVELTVSPSLIGHTHIFSVFVRDITERRRTEQRLAAQFAITQILAESKSIQDICPKILQAICDHLGWSVGVWWMLDKPHQRLNCFDIRVSAPGVAEEFVGETWRLCFTVGNGLPGRIWAAGKPAWISDVTTDPNFPRRSSAFQAGLHGAFGFPIRVGQEVHGVIELYVMEVREPDEELLKMAADFGFRIGQLIERLRAEEALRQTEEQLRQSQKMEAVGRLAGGIAHDFNNLLTVIRGYCELIMGRLRSDDPMRKEVEEVKKAGDRAAGLTNQLLAFSRRQFVSTKTLDLNEVISGMDGMLRRLIGEDLVELGTVLAPSLGKIKADPTQIEQVIMNLAVNSHDAMPDGGKLTVSTANVMIDKRHRLAPVMLEPGAYVLLTIQDTGCGMDPEIRSHIFEPFFTTKEKGKGTGLGLSTVYGIVKQTGGHIEVDSMPGEGATFRIYFPCVEEADLVAESNGGMQSEVRGKETVLVVEDEPAVRYLVQETLRMHGYSVLLARHGIEALLTGAKHLGPIHLLLTDVVMPQMSGPEVAEKLCLARPELKVLYMSGYPDHPVFAKGGIRVNAALLQKPFSPQELAQKVREVLDRPAPAAKAIA
ncbi:MAG: ATP-binding protein [Nitrospiraceae bacterium]